MEYRSRNKKNYYGHIFSCHSPTITNQVEFFHQNTGPPPVVTSRINFIKQLATKELAATEDSTEDDNSTMNIDINPAFVTPESPLTNVDSDSGVEETTDLLSDAVDKKILKPRGQVDHPGSGGYSLDFLLWKWGLTLIADVNVSN